MREGWVRDTPPWLRSGSGSKRHGRGDWDLVTTTTTRRRRGERERSRREREREKERRERRREKRKREAWRLGFPSLSKSLQSFAQVSEMREKWEEAASFIGKGGNPRSFTLIGCSLNGLSLINFWARNRAVTILPHLNGIRPRIPCVDTPTLTSRTKMGKQLVLWNLMVHATDQVPYSSRRSNVLLNPKSILQQRSHP